MQFTQRQINILSVIRQSKAFSSSTILAVLSHKPSLVTLKRDLLTLTKSGYLIQNGKGRSVTYSLSVIGKLFLPIDAKAYCAIEPDQRYGDSAYDFELFENMPITFFSEEELSLLEFKTTYYKNRSSEVSSTIHQKELGRFIVELSWKSSKIEGNTYTLLDTERLLLEGIPAAGHSADEATMILNHKKAFDFIIEHNSLFKSLITQNTVEEVHRLLITGLDVAKGIRRSAVGVTGSTYHPLDNEYQIREAFEALYTAVARVTDIYSKSLLLLVGLSYIQGFEDGNKRTARLSANAVLLAHNAAPLSYRSVDEVSYREAMLVFYETQSITPIKEIFITQYVFAAEQYLLGKN
jgi:prophage maintenance system killer protein